MYFKNDDEWSEKIQKYASSIEPQTLGFGPKLPPATPLSWTSVRFWYPASWYHYIAIHTMNAALQH